MTVNEISHIRCANFMLSRRMALPHGLSTQNPATPDHRASGDGGFQGIIPNLRPRSVLE